MAAAEYVPLYRKSCGEADRNNEKDLWEPSFRENVSCARAIEKSLRDNYDEKTDQVNRGCVLPVIEDYGVRRVEFVLAHTIRELDENPNVRHLLDPKSVAWAGAHYAPPDPVYGRYYMADIAASLLEAFLREEQEYVHSLGLFGQEHCSAGMYDADVTGKVLVMKPDTLKDQYWSPENQLWLAKGGFGCNPKASGRAIYAYCLADGEDARWNREDFCGVLDVQYLPEWAREKLEALRAPDQEQAAAPAMSGMEM